MLCSIVMEGRFRRQWRGKHCRVDQINLLVPITKNGKRSYDYDQNKCCRHIRERGFNLSVATAQEYVSYSSAVVVNSFVAIGLSKYTSEMLSLRHKHVCVYICTYWVAKMSVKWLVNCILLVEYIRNFFIICLIYKIYWKWDPPCSLYNSQRFETVLLTDWEV